MLCSDMRLVPDAPAWRLQAAHFPAPEHRTAALAAQAAALYLALWFVPQVLHQDAALMRALVDRCAAPLPEFRG